MDNPLVFLTIFITLLFTPRHTLASDTACRSTCGSLQIKYPFGTGNGCGSPRFHPHVTCATGNDTTSERLLLTTHTGTYPVTSISYTTTTLTITPPYMSTCTIMQSSPNLGLDWASPFQLGPSTFILLSCLPPTSSLKIKGSPICDPSSSHLCASIYTCPAVIDFGLPLFPPTNTCCVYFPANFNSKGELDLQSLHCAGYTSVTSLGDYPTDPSKWKYGVTLNYKERAFESYNVETKCNSCEMSGGVCGYATHDNSFLCVCQGVFNSSTDCYSYNPDDESIWSSNSSQAGNILLGLLGGIIVVIIGG